MMNVSFFYGASVLIMLSFIKHHILWTIILFVVTALSVAAILFSLNGNNVEYLSPRQGNITESIYGLGKVKTDQVYDAKIAIIKSIKKLYVKEGDFVNKGSKLVELEDQLILRAPFSGTVSFVAFHESQPVFPQQTILRLEDLSQKYIEVSLEQQGALRVAKDQLVRVLFESIRGEQLKGKVAAIFARNEEFLAHITVDGLGENVLPGMTADIAIEVGTRNNVTLVPLSAVSNGRIKILRDGKKKTLQVKIGGIDGNWAEVLEGDLKSTDQIIIQRK